MRICLAAIGSTGDVLPYLGLGQHLASQGLDVTVATHGLFKPLVKDAGLAYSYVPMEPHEYASEEMGQRLRRGPLSAAKAVQEVFTPWIWDIAAAIDTACKNADGVLLSAMAWTGMHSAEGLGIPSMGVYLQPFEPTGAFAPVAMGARSFGAILNRALGRKAQTMMVQPYMSVVNDIRAQHGLPGITAGEHLRRMRARDWPILHGYSRTVAPQPADWRAGLRVVGYWWPPTPAGWAPSRALVDFLGSGPTPIYVGFGSALPAETEDLRRMVRRLVYDLRVRVVVHSGWLDLRIEDDDILTVDHVPHSWLFPRVRAAVHHAGAGTSAAALRAGIPSIPVPLSLDQPFWASRLHKLGTATRPLPASRLTYVRLRAAVERALGDQSMKRRGAEVSAMIAKEHGSAAVALAVSEWQS